MRRSFFLIILVCLLTLSAASPGRNSKRRRKQREERLRQQQEATKVINEGFAEADVREFRLEELAAAIRSAPPSVMADLIAFEKLLDRAGDEEGDEMMHQFRQLAGSDIPVSEVTRGMAAISRKTLRRLREERRQRLRDAQEQQETEEVQDTEERQNARVLQDTEERQNARVLQDTEEL